MACGQQIAQMFMLAGYAPGVNHIKSPGNTNCFTQDPPSYPEPGSMGGIHGDNKFLWSRNKSHSGEVGQNEVLVSCSLGVAGER